MSIFLKSILTSSLMIKYPLAIGDSLGSPMEIGSCEGYIHAQRKTKEPKAQLLEPLGPGSTTESKPLCGGLSWMVCAQGRDDTDTVSTFMAFVCFLPTMFYPLETGEGKGGDCYLSK